MIRIFFFVTEKKLPEVLLLLLIKSEAGVCVCVLLSSDERLLSSQVEIFQCNFCELNYETQRTCSRCRHDKNLRLNTVSV